VPNRQYWANLPPLRHCQRVSSFVDALGIGLINVSPAFAAHPDPVSLYSYRLATLHSKDDVHARVAHEVLTHLERAE